MVAVLPLGRPGESGRMSNLVTADLSELELFIGG